MQITLVGLDVVNTSLGLALKAVAPEIQIMGNDRDRDRAKMAAQAHAVDKTHWNLLSACDGADLVIVSEPQPQLEVDLAALAPELAAEVVVFALASTQRPVQALFQRIGARAACVSGHLVAPGLTAAATPAASLLQQALCYIVAAPSTSAEALQTAANVAEAVGARPCFADADEVDGIIAATEQVPQMLALALLSALAHAGAQRDFERGLSPALGEIARHSPTPEDLAALSANRDNLVRWVSAFSASLQEAASWVSANDAKRLSDEVTAVRQALDRWAKGEEEPTTQVSKGSTWRQMFLGQWRPGRRG